MSNKRKSLELSDSSDSDETEEEQEPSTSVDAGLHEVDGENDEAIEIESADEDVVVVEEEEDAFANLQKLVLLSPQNANKIITKENLKIKFNKPETSKKYSPFYACIEPSVHGETVSFVCLLCALMSIVHKRESGLKLIKGKNISQNFRSHATQMHPDILGKDETKVKPLIELLMNLFGKKVGKEVLVKLTESEIQEAVQGTTYFKAVSTGIARVRQALWLMTSTLPSTVVENDLNRSFIRSLNQGFNTMSRNTESNMELAMFGFCVKQIRKRIKDSYEHFKSKFMCLECDVWTAQSNLSVLGVGVTFYDVSLKKAVTVVLGAVPLVKGKTAVELLALIKRILKLFDIKPKYINSAVGDGEKAVQNCLNYLVESRVFVCLAHFKLLFVIQRVVLRRCTRKIRLNQALTFLARCDKLLSYLQKVLKRKED